MLTRFIKAYYQYIVVLIVVLVIYITNYKSSTYLTGWDNLQTDLNPVLGIKRSFFAAWQEYQSFGLTSGLAHAADFLRSVFIWIVSFVIPPNLVRYFYHFLMILVGALGMLHLLKTILGEKSKVFSLTGAIFYILNFGTVQLFYLPWESFSTFFAFLPWGLWMFTRVLENIKEKKYWIFFIIINFIATPSFYVQTVFIVYLLILLSFGIGRSLETRSIKILKNLFFVLSIVLIINAFWILPQAYSFLTRADVVTNAKNNLLSTESVVYQNMEKGTIWHFLKMEGFYSELYGKSKTLLFLPWKEHFQNFFISTITLIFTAIFVTGIIASLFKKNAYRFSFFAIFVLTAIALLNNTPVFEQINGFLREQNIINQIFRSPFTKFVVPYALVASYGFTIGISLFYNLIQKHNILSKIPKAAIAIFFCSLIFIYSLPSFQGHYISSEMKVNLPNAYIQAVDFFKNEDKNKRIALLPDSTSWGWFNHNWGYNGSGFLWYAIEQPVVSRTFDVWSNESESYFWETKSALEAQDVKRFEAILEKYNIDYLFYDRSLLPVSGKSIQYKGIDSIIQQSTTIKAIEQFEFISIYRIERQNKVSNFIQISSPIPNIGPRITLTNNDTAYLEYGPYMTAQQKAFQIYYPFLDLTTQTKVTKKAWNIFELPSEWLFTSYLPFEANSYSFALESQNEFNLYINGTPTKLVLPLSPTVDKNTLIMRFPKLKISNFDLTQSTIENCSDRKGLIDKQNLGTSIIIKTDKGAIACIGYTDQNLSQQYGYLIKVVNENIQGQRLLFYILDRTREENYLEDRLKKDEELYIVAPRLEQGRGYSFIFHNNSYENIASINKLNSLDVYLVPYNQIKNIALRKTDSTLEIAASQTEFNARKTNHSSYSVSGESLYGNTLILHQSFDPGWKAYEVKSDKKQEISWADKFFPFIFGRELKEHAVVNNWANGWLLDSNPTIQQFNNSAIIIVFWPQYLQYLGFLILTITLLWLVYSNFKKIIFRYRMP